MSSSMCSSLYPFNKTVNACLHGRTPSPRASSAILSDKRTIFGYLVKARHVYPIKIIAASLILTPSKVVREEENCRMHESIEADPTTDRLLRGNEPAVPLLNHLPDPRRPYLPVLSFGNHCTSQCTDLLTSLAQLVYIFLTVRKWNCVPSWKGPKWTHSNIYLGSKDRKEGKKEEEGKSSPLSRNRLSNELSYCAELPVKCSVHKLYCEFI